MSMTAFADGAGYDPEGTTNVVVSVEKFTLGAGYIAEPTVVTVNSGASAADAVFSLFDSLGIKAESPSYLSKVGDSSTEINIPDVLVTAIGAAVQDPNNGWDYIDDEKQDADYLQAEDYTATGAWMFFANNEMASVGMADYKVSEGDVIRLQFSLYGWGEDLAPGASWGYYPPLEGVEFADKDELTRAIAELRYTYDDETLSANAAYKSAYETAVKFGASQTEVSDALTALDSADIKSTDIRAPYLGAQTSLRSTAAVFGSEWNVLALSRGEYPFYSEENSGFYTHYLDSVKAAVKENKGEPKPNASATDIARTVIGVTAAGLNAENVAGYNLLERLADLDFAQKQGLNGAVYTLIALDTHAYDIPDTGAENKTTREALITTILDNELENGGWTFYGTVADPDMTGMALQALAPYYNDNADVKAAVDKALALLSDTQDVDGLWTSWGMKSSPSAAQVLTALCALGIDPDTDTRFIKNGITVPEALTGFAVSGGYANTIGEEANAIATQQTSYALAAYYRQRAGKTSLYDMSDIRLDASIDEVSDTSVIIYSPVSQNAAVIWQANGEVKHTDTALHAGMNEIADISSPDAVYLWESLSSMKPLCEKK